MVKLAPVLLVGRVAVSGFDVARVVPYVPPDAPAFVERGRTSLKLNMVWKREPGRIDTAYVNGDVEADGVAVTQPGRPAPFLTARRAEARIASADLIAGSVVLERVALAGLEGNAVRDRLGRIDLLLSPEARRLGEEAAATLAAGALPEEPGQATGDRVWRVRIERLDVTEATVALEDLAVAPPRQWRLDDLAAEGQGLSTVAGDPPGRVAARARMVTAPRGGEARALAGTAGVALDLTVVREVARPDAPIIAGLLSLDVLGWTRAGRAAPVLGVGTAAVQITRADPIGREIALADVRVEGVEGAVVREPDGTLDLVAALQAVVLPAAPAPPAAGPPASAAGEETGEAAWRVRVAQAALSARRLVLTDRTASPARDVRVEGLSVSARGVSTEPADPPATLALSAQITAPEADRPMSLRVDADRLRVLPVEAQARLRVAGFDLRTLAPFLPPALPAAPAGGLVEADLALRFLEDQARALRADLDGRVRLADLAVAPRGGGAPLVTLPRLDVAVRKADFLAGSAELASVELAGPHAVITRDEGGRVDVLAMVDELTAAPAAGTGAPPARTGVDPATRPLLAALVRAFDRPWSVRLDRLALRDGKAEFDDRFVSPATRVGPTGITLDVVDFAWPMKSKAPFDLAMAMPGGGRTEAKGHLQLEPLDIQLVTSTRDAPLEPYQAYFPFPARLSGRLNGDSLNEVQRGPDGVLILASRGSALGEDLEARAPGAQSPAARVERFEIKNIDFSWPNYAIVERITVVEPSASVEREKDGSINLRALFTPVDRGNGIPATDAAGRDWTLLIRTDEDLGPGKPPREEGPLLETIVLDFEEIAVEDGHLRFLDRSTTPPLSQELSKFHLSVKGLSNVLGRRPTSLTAQGVVDGEGTLDLRGESSGIGERLRAELVGELKDFPLATANPYAQSTGWVVDRGRLTTKIHYRVEGDQLVAEHDILVKDLKVAQARDSDVVARRIGLPLGLIVALLKDTGGDIDFTVPIKASVKDRTIDWEETVLVRPQAGDPEAHRRPLPRHRPRAEREGRGRHHREAGRRPGDLRRGQRRRRAGHGDPPHAGRGLPPALAVPHPQPEARGDVRRRGEPQGPRADGPHPGVPARAPDRGVPRRRARVPGDARPAQPAAANGRRAARRAPRRRARPRRQDLRAARPAPHRHAPGADRHGGDSRGAADGCAPRGAARRRGRRPRGVRGDRAVSGAATRSAPRLL